MKVPVTDRGDQVSDRAAAGGSAEWRRITLDRQLPRVGIASSTIAPALICLLGLLAVAGLSAVLLRPPHRATIPAAVLSSQRGLVTQLVSEIRSEIDDTDRQLTEVASAYASQTSHDPASVLPQAAKLPGFRGATVIDTKHAAVIATGESIPLDTVPPDIEGPTNHTIIGADNIPRLLVVMPLYDGRALLTSSNLTLPRLHLDSTSQQSILIVLQNGEITQSQGAQFSESNSKALRLLRTAIGKATRRAADVVGSVPQPNRQLAGSSLIVSAAPYRALGMHAVSVIYASPASAGDPRRSYIEAGALATLALIAFLIVVWTMFRPLRRLERHARAVACGEIGPHRKRPRWREFVQIAGALDAAASTMRSGSARQRRHRTLPIVSALVVATLLPLSWAGYMAFDAVHGLRQLPTQLVEDSQNQTEASAIDFANSMATTLRTLTQLVVANSGEDPANLRPVLSSYAAKAKQFRSVYVVDPAGHASEVVGKEPLRAPSAITGPDETDLDHGGGRSPVIYAHAAMANGYALVAEYDVERLRDVMRVDSWRLRVVDDSQRVILDTDGFVAFEKLGDSTLRTVAKQAASGSRPVQIGRIGQRQEFVAAAALPKDNNLGQLRWSLVAERRLDSFAFSENTLHRRAWLLSALAISLALLFFGWNFVKIVLPIRKIGVAADRLRSGDLKTTLSPIRADEIGSIAMCLDICRQALVHGAQRLAGATRLRGTDGDHTHVMSKITDDLPGQRGSKPKSRKRGESENQS